ncbi:TRAP transporter small permease subunit [Thiohalobacter sp. IOR34]|uniref:TRAP transporter small permease n=1 Tax=Thiohalobacter sp. IOR34 TaxID=3057176 RepID=UPI0025AF8AFA|nr:TRAP transporter small permease subunit [Thiohalobacter sp. IOR34]WJW76553.1 TRAP transporter small permease subunit [Thiohalobacter sp. IOR34]
MTWATASLNGLRRALVRLEIYLAGTSLLLLLLITLGQIVARNLFDTGLSAADTLARHLVLYVTFLGAALASDARAHIKIDVIAAWLPDHWTARLYRPLQTVGLLITGLLLQAAGRFWWDEWSYAAGYERWAVLFNLILPVGFGLLGLHFLLGLLLGPDEGDGGA